MNLLLLHVNLFKPCQFTLAMGLRRKFLYREPKNFRLLPHSSGRLIKKECEGRIGRECLLQPVSNCDAKRMNRILEDSKQRKSLFVLDSNRCTKLQRAGINTLDAIINVTSGYDVVQYRHTFQSACDLWKLQQSMNKELTLNISKQNGYDLQYQEVCRSLS